MPSVKQEMDDEAARAFACGKAAGEANSGHELSQLRAKLAKLETEAADLRKAVAEQTTPEMMRAMNAFAEGRSPCCGESLIEQGTSRFCSKCKNWVARVCGPSSATCKCQCPDGPCEHEWNGEVEEGSMGGGGTYSSSTCSRCGMSAMSHSMWVGP